MESVGRRRAIVSPALPFEITIHPIQGAWAALRVARGKMPRPWEAAAGGTVSEAESSQTSVVLRVAFGERSASAALEGVSPSRILTSWNRGDVAFTRRQEHGGANILLFEGALKDVTDRSVAALIELTGFLERMATWGVNGEIDVALFVGERMSISVFLHPRLTSLAARFGLTIRVSAYATSDDE